MNAQGRMKPLVRIVHGQVTGGILSMISLRSIALAAMTALTLGTAQAAYIVDTGSGSTDFWSLGNDPFFQSLGATFNVDAASTVNSVEGWIGASKGVSGNVLVELIAGGSPNGSVLYSATFGVTSAGSFVGAWQGAFGLNWLVAAGDYTLAFYALPGFTGYMPGGAPNALPVEWFRNRTTNNAWTQNGQFALGIGVRVDAAPSAVPEPGTVALLGLGLVGLALARRRKQQSFN